MRTRTPPPAGNCADCAVHKDCAIGQLGDAERAPLASRLRHRILHRGDLLIEESLPAQQLRFIKLGTVIACRRGLDGRSRPIGVISRGSALGIFGAFDMPSQASCVALTTVRVCEISIVSLRDMGACGAGLITQLIRAMAENFAAMAAWSEAMRLPGVINQLAYVVLLLANANRSSVIELPSHSALGELLGTRRETVARALGKLESDGGIQREERRRCVVFRDALLARLAALEN